MDFNCALCVASAKVMTQIMNSNLWTFKSIKVLQKSNDNSPEIKLTIPSNLLDSTICFRFNVTHFNGNLVIFSPENALLLDGSSYKFGSSSYKKIDLKPLVLNSVCLMFDKPRQKAKLYYKGNTFIHNNFSIGKYKWHLDI